MLQFTITPRRFRAPLACEEPTQEEYDAFWKRKGCIPMVKDRTLCQDSHITAVSTADEYCRIIETYRRGFIKERECWSMLSRVGRTSI